MNSNVDFPSFVKLGVFSHNHYNDDHSSVNHESVNVVDTVYEPDNSFGMFLTSDLNLWQQNNKSLNLFIQAGYSPSDNSVTNLYFGTGVNYAGLFSSDGYDELGLALNFQHFNEGDNVNDYESVIELTYNYQLTDNFYIQPDFQYIINPSGLNEELDNDLVCFIRFGIDF